MHKFKSRVVKCSYLPVIRRKRVRMTRRVKPPTAAVTMTNTWPWSDAMSDAEGGGERRMVRKKGSALEEKEEGGGPKDCGKRENRKRKRK